MSSNCHRIQVFPLFTLPAQWLDGDGNVWLDLPPDSSARLNKAVSELEGNDIITDSVIPASVPKTAKNRAILNQFFDANLDNKTYDPMACMIYVGSKVIDTIELSGVRDVQDAYEIQITRSNEHWSKAAGNLYLNTLPLGELLFNEANVRDNWANNFLYANGDVGVWFPLAFYGKWRKPGTTVVEDFRPYFHVLKLLQEGFKAIGYCFRSTFYETNLGRRAISYLLAESYGDDEPLRALREFSATTTKESANFDLQIITDWTDILDPGNSFDEVNGIYQAPVEAKFYLDVEAIFQQVIFGPAVVVIQIVKFDGVNEEIIVSNTFPLTQSNNTLHAEGETTLLPGEQIYVKAQITTANDIDLIFRFNNDVKSTYYAEGDTFDLAELIDQDITLLDLLKGAQHIIDGKIEEDIESKTVWLRPPYDTTFIEDDITGYYIPDVIDLRQRQDCDSRQVTSPDPLRGRYEIIEFANSTDEHINALKLSNNSPLFSKTVDYGDQYEPDMIRNANPLFEPTATDNPQNISGIFTPPEVPFLIDNDNEEISYKIRPRILIAHGYAQQLLEAPDGSTVPLQWRFKGQQENAVPYASQLPKNDFVGQVIDDKLIYGDQEDDLYSAFWSRDLLENNYNQSENHLIYMYPEQYWTFSLRNRYLIESDGQPVYGRIKSIEDFRSCADVLTPITFYPEKQGDNVCFEPSPPPDPCDANAPIIQYELIDNCFTFSIGGVTGCQIDTIQWQYRVFGDTVWTNLGTGSTETVCNQTERFQIRAVITYAAACACDPSTPIITLDPCGNNPQCLITTSVDQVNGFCVEFDLVGQYSEGLIVVQYDNGGGLMILPGPPWVVCDPDTGTLLFDWTYTPNDGCAPITGQCSITIPPPDLNCEANLPVLVCVPEDIGGIICHTWIIEGTLVGEVETFIVTYECSDGSTGTWTPGDGPVCCDGDITAHALVFICNCPPICTNETVCSGGCTFPNEGVPTPVAACN